MFWKTQNYNNPPLLEKYNLATEISDQNWSWCVTYVNNWISDRNEWLLNTSVAAYVKNQEYFSHRNSDRYVVEDSNRSNFGSYMKIIATENNSVADDIKVFRLATELSTEITFFLYKWSNKIFIYDKL